MSGPEAASLKPATGRRPLHHRPVIRVSFVLGVAIILFGIFLELAGPINRGFDYQTTRTQQAATLWAAMVAYANDHNQYYPDGNSSTEVFQKLLDGGYVTEPRTFYIPLAGKTEARPGEKLKPENVCWDVTSGVDVHASDDLPVIYMTGYRVMYAPGGDAVPFIKPYPRYNTYSWFEWWQRHGLMPQPSPVPGIAVGYGYNYGDAKFIKFDATMDPHGTIPDFISTEFDPGGKTYRQLTPDGALP